MNIQFLGAAGEVTGSCHLISVNNFQILLECGLVQGRPEDEARNYQPFPFDPKKIDAVILSHSHIDHSGRLPLLHKRGFNGPVYTNPACADLCQIMLQDAGHINEKDVQWENKKRQRKNLSDLEPLYSVNDADAVLSQFVTFNYGKKYEILPGVSVRFNDAGHILGSSIIELWLTENDEQRKLVFSGDLGHKNSPIVRDPSIIHDADLVIMESTYGDRLHRSQKETEIELQNIIEEAYRNKGNILIPSFAVGRSQDLIYLFSKFYDEWHIQNWQIFLDSPMAIKATAVYAQHSHLYDDDMIKLLAEKQQTLLPNLHFLHEAADSMKLNNIASGAIIIAGSGMCTGGRIRHHIKHHAWKKNHHIVIVGFQVEGTTGRALVDGKTQLNILGETINVQAKVHTIGGLSAHADQAGLIEWYGQFKNHPPLVLVHGETHAMAELAMVLNNRYSAIIKQAAMGESLDLLQFPAQIAS